MTNMIYPDFNYPKPKRFPIGNLPKGKEPLSQEHLKYLLQAKVIVEEKMDGSTVRFVSSDPPIYVFAEDLKRMHSVFYHVPARYAVFDIFDLRRNVFVYPEEKTHLSEELRSGRIKIVGLDGSAFFPIPRIATGHFTIEDLLQFVGKSAYAKEERDFSPAPGEGIVVKPYADAFRELFIMGKIVRSEFMDAIQQNYLNLPYRANAIDPSVDVVLQIR